jgi:hypothetical protein
MEQMKLAELKPAIDRVEFRAREAEKVNNTKWAGELRTFAGKLRDYRIASVSTSTRTPVRKSGANSTPA